MPTVPPLVDQFGNISVHAREDLRVPIQGGDTGVGIDLSTKTYFFEVLAPNGRPIIRVSVGVHPTQPTWKMVVVTREQLSEVPSSGATFVLLDETAGGCVPRWEGFIKRRGL